MLRYLYKKYIHSPTLDRFIYRILDVMVNFYTRTRGYRFPKNYIRRWKLDMLHELYEKETVALFEEIVKPGMTIVDIGAHIGYFTRLFSKLSGENGMVYAFEADPTNFALLEHNTRGRKNVQLAQLALTDKTGVIDFYHYADKSGAHSTLPNVPLNFAKQKITVTSTTLDSWREKERTPRVDVIKMDIEGGESAAIRGMTRTLRDVKVLITEFAPAWIRASGSTSVNFLQSIEQHGFKISAITQGGLINLSPIHDEHFMSLLPTPKDGSHASEFINLYCVK